MWRIVAVDSITRRVFFDLTSIAEASWSTKLNGSHSVDVTVHVRDAVTPLPVEILAMLEREQKQTVIVVGWVQPNGVTFGIADAFIDSSDFRPDEGVIVLSGESLWSLMRERLIYPLWARPNIVGVLDSLVRHSRSIEAVVAGQIDAAVGAGRTILLGGRVLYEPNGHPSRHLPLTLVEESETQVKDWSVPFKERSALDALDELLSFDGAPDVAIQPILTDERLSWLVAVGVDMARWEAELVHDRAEGFKSRITDLSIKRDGVNGMTKLLKVGGGSGKSMQTVVSTIERVGGTLTGVTRERVTSAKQADTSGQLLTQADAEMRRYAHDVKQWSFGVECDDSFPPTWFMPGVNIRLQYGGDELNPAGERLFQVLGVSGSTASMRLGLEIQHA